MIERLKQEALELAVTGTQLLFDTTSLRVFTCYISELRKAMQMGMEVLVLGRDPPTR